MSEPEDSTPIRSSTGASYSTTTAPNGSTYVNYQDDDDVMDDAFESGGAAPGEPGQATSHNARLDSSSTGYASTRAATFARCIALYGFQVGRQGRPQTLTYDQTATRSPGLPF